MPPSNNPQTISFNDIKSGIGCFMAVYTNITSPVNTKAIVKYLKNTLILAPLFSVLCFSLFLTITGYNNLNNYYYLLSVMLKVLTPFLILSL